ncbi:MAG: MBL fold metallo-hydrolase [Acidimicrobiia bacterium]|nr:MBL fold metallo-hydrolase [Acidimicrobiia bacterium]
MTRRLIIGTMLAWAFMAGATLDIHFIDVEGGQATLIVTPAKESLLVDAGWPGFEGRDAGRIVAAAKKAGLARIDYLMVTHYHRDHVGGVEQLAGQFPIGTYVDHGPNRETGKAPDELWASYEKAFAKGKRLIVKPGDKIPLKGVPVTVVTADGEHIAKSMPGGGAQNPLCAAESQKAADPGENARSTGILVQMGDFRFLDIGDLTWNKELELVCPVNRIGAVDVYLTTHHGMDTSGPAAIVHALRPRVAIMNNGARKGGAAPAWQIVKNSPGLEDLWQVHFAVAGGDANNVTKDQIANLEEQCQGHGLSISASQNGEFTVTNHRNGASKTYRKKK